MPYHFIIDFMEVDFTDFVYCFFYFKCHEGKT